MTHHLYGSLLAADLLCLKDEIKHLESLGISGLHIDIMDGHYVPPISFGPQVVARIKENFPHMPLHVHLMIQNPDQRAQDYIQAGATTLSFHPRCSSHPLRLIERIKKSGVRASLAMNPEEPLEDFRWLLGSLDEILVMGVVPGYSGQAFLPMVLEKISLLSQIKDCPRILIDGGVTDHEIKELIKAGAKDFVLGSFLFQNPKTHLSLIQNRVSAKCRFD